MRKEQKTPFVSCLKWGGLLVLSATVAACGSSSKDKELDCEDGMLDCEGICVDTMNNVYNCGECGVNCADGEVCVSGNCELYCPGGLDECNGGCVNLQTDRANCGTCGNGCEAGEVCSAGSCELSCHAGLDECDGVCVDTENDPSNCGGCGEECEENEFCWGGACTHECPDYLEMCDGVCVDMENDPHNCGGCGEVCTGFCFNNDCFYLRSCLEIKNHLPDSEDGVYIIDPDRLGAGDSIPVYCDMTTDGGGWTLTYKVRNDIDQDDNPWWDQVLPGSSADFPLDLLWPADSTEGPLSDTRAELFEAVEAVEWRATQIDNTDGSIIFDVKTSYTGSTGRGFRCFATGTCTTANQDCSPNPDGYIMTNTTSMGLPAGSWGHLCDVGWTGCDVCVDFSSINEDACAGCWGVETQYVGDTYIGASHTFTAYWIR